MDLEKIKKLAELVLRELNKYTGLYLTTSMEASLRNLVNLAHKTLPEHKEFFVYSYNSIKGSSYFSVLNAVSIVNHILEIVEIEKATETKIKEMRIFESAEDKMKQSGLSFRKDDYASTFHNLNTALELVLKGKLGIPTTITKINTSNIIEVLVKHKVDPYLYLNEAKKRIVMIDNKIKHQGYSPSKIDCINGIKVMEELIAKLRDKEIKLSEEVRKKIYEGL